MRDWIIDWLLFVTAILIAIAVMFTHAVRTFGDEQFVVSYAATTPPSGFTVTYDNPWFPPKPPPKASLPIVDMRTASWCGKCPGIKKAIEESGLFILNEVSAEDDESVPSLSWQTPAGRKGFTGWHGLEHLKREVARTTGTPVGPQTQRAVCAPWTAAQLRAFASTYRGPMTGVKRGNYWSHLLEHGFVAWQIQGLSQSECARIHGAVHAGLLSPVRFHD